jgi:hypothetical protein
MSYPYGSGGYWPVPSSPAMAPALPYPETAEFPYGPPLPRRSRRGAWIYAACVATIVLTLAAGLTLAFVGSHKPDIAHLTEAMLLEKSDVPPLSGGSWERQLRDTVPPSVTTETFTATPRVCNSPFQMNRVGQSGTAQWTKQAQGPSNTLSDISYGVTISVPPNIDNAALSRWADSCSSFEIGMGSLKSKAEVHRLHVSGVPKWAVAYRLTVGDTDAADSVGIVGVYRAVLIHAFYGSYGSPIDPDLRDGLAKIFNAEVAKLRSV